VLGFALRLQHLTDPPFDFHPVRQFHSVVIAHWLYVEGLPTVPAWEAEIARLNSDDEPFLEPPIIELLATTGYRLLGAEQLGVPRVLSSLFWVIGGVFLYLLARQMSSETEALTASTIYLFLPFGVQASRSFQPDPLMVMLLIAALWAMVRWDASRSRGRLGLAIALAAAAIFAKPSSAFLVYAAFGALTIHRFGARRLVLQREIYVFGLLSLLPILVYSADGYFVSGFLRGQEEGRFLPQLLLTRSFWTGWAVRVNETVGYVPYLVALGGGLLLTAGIRRALLLGLWVGYAILCLFFTYNTPTHSYYHLPLLPIVALSLSPLAGPRLRNRRWRRSGIACLIALWLISVGISIRQLDSFQQGQQIAVAREIGERLSHSTRTLFLAESFGLPLRYYGELSGASWPSTSELTLEALEGRAMTVQERFDAFGRSLRPDFFVVTRFDMFREQPDLRAYLDRFPVFADTVQYLIFDLRHTAVEEPELRGVPTSAGLATGGTVTPVIQTDMRE